MLWYGEAIKEKPSKVLYGNRSASLLGLSRAEEALADAVTCTEMAPAGGVGRLGAFLTRILCV